MDETSIKVKGQWYYLYRAVDKTGQTIDCLLTAQRGAHVAYGTTLAWAESNATISWR